MLRRRLGRASLAKVRMNNAARKRKTDFWLGRIINHPEDFVKASFVGLMQIPVDQIAGGWFLMGRTYLV